MVKGIFDARKADIWSLGVVFVCWLDHHHIINQLILSSIFIYKNGIIDQLLFQWKEIILSQLKYYHYYTKCWIMIQTKDILSMMLLNIHGYHCIIINMTSNAQKIAITTTKKWR